MSVVNLITQKYALMVSTLVFWVTCLINSLLLRRAKNGPRISALFFTWDLFLLFIFFVVCGSPEGFSAIWACLVPSCGLLLFGRKRGSIISGIMFAMLVFFFWLPLGRSLLQYEYTASFKLRFPMLYIAFYAVSLFLETIRNMTQKQLLKAKEEYKYLYLHDALTGIYNRYGFDQQMDSTLNNIGTDGIALMILDLDNFKLVNDRYGHVNGDIVLKHVASLLMKLVNDRGTVCRWGGEEFAVLLHSSHFALSLARLICTRIDESKIEVAGDTIHISASIGITIFTHLRSISAADLVRRTDSCLYEAKDRGRNQVVFQLFEDKNVPPFDHKVDKGSSIDANSVDQCSQPDF